MSEEETVPPRQPNTFRTWLPRIWKWLIEHPVWFAGGAGLLAGYLLPKIVSLL